METKRKWGTYTYINQNGLQTKNDNEKQRRSLYHNIGGNSSRIVINVYVPNIRAPRYIKQILTYPKREIDVQIIV